MKKKAWLTYLLTIILIILVVYFGNSILEGYHNFTKHNIIINPVIFEIIFYIILGILLGLEHFIQEIKKAGKWRLNIAKLVLLGIPSIYFSFGIFIYFGLGRFLPHVLTYPIAILINNTSSILPVFQMILGYCIITIFIKNEQIKER